MIEILFAFTLMILSISLYYNFKFGIFILDIVDSIEESLDELDEKYRIFKKILEKPVFFDSVEIRQVIQEIRACQDLLLVIANKISKPGRSIIDEKEQKE